MMRSKTEAEKRAAMIDQHLYDEEARHILSLGSVEEIERFVATTVGLDHTLLSRTLEQMAQRLFGMGRAAEARLTHFVLDIVNDFIRRREAPVPQPKNIITFETLMDAAAAAPSALRAVTLLRQHSHLLSLEGADQFQSLVLEQLNKARPHSSPRAVRLLLCLVMVGKLLNDPERAATYQILWGGYCRNEGRYRHALRRLARAEEIGNAIKNPFLQISSLAGRASLYELLGNNARAADAYLKALNLARESGNEYLTPPTVIKLAGCYRGMHRYSDALQLVDSALSSSTLLAVAPDIHDEHVLQCRMLRGLLLEDLGRYDEGLGEYQQAAKIAEAYGNRPKQFMALNNIAASHMKVGDHREALRSYNGSGANA